MRGIYSSSFYQLLPVFLQRAFVTFKGFCYSLVRNGLTFRQFRKRVTRVETFSADQIAEFQLAKLREVLIHAGTQVPFYRRAFKEAGFSPYTVNSPEDLSGLPMISKDLVFRFHDAFIAEDMRGKHLYKGHTSGTTGKSLSLYMDADLIKYENAFADRQYRWAGASIHGRIAFLRGDVIVPSAQCKPPFWRYDAYNRQLWLSSFHISAETVPAYVNKLIQWNPESIFAYPSAVFSLCRLARHHGINFHIPRLKGVITSSETVTKEQKQIIEETLKVQVFDWYGMFERVIFIGTCEKGKRHAFPDYGITEYLPLGTLDENGDELFELVGTGFINRAMPLIRYRTGDLVTLDKSARCACGRHFPIIKSILGRYNDLVITPSGRRIAHLGHIFSTIESILCGQIIQETRDRLQVRVAPDIGFNEKDRLKMMQLLKSRLEPNMKIDFELVENIPRVANGKFRCMVSKL